MMGLDIMQDTLLSYVLRIGFRIHGMEPGDFGVGDVVSPDPMQGSVAMFCSVTPGLSILLWESQLDPTLLWQVTGILFRAG